LEREFREVPEDDRKLFAQKVFPTLTEELDGTREEEIGERGERYNLLVGTLVPIVEASYHVVQ